MAGVSQRHETHGKLEEHVRLIRQCIQRSVDDPATRQLAFAITSGNFDNMRDPRSGEEVPVVPYYGRWYRGAASWEDAAELCRMRDYRCSVQALFNWASINLFYGQDVDGEDTYATLRATCEAGGGDCDDLTIVMASLLKSVGFENVVARIVSLEGTTWDHIYPVVLIPQSGWCAIELTEPGRPLGWEYKNIAAKRDFAL